MNISGFGGFNPAEIQQRMQSRFNNADTDGSGGVSLAEAVDAAPEGADTSRMEKMFNQMDSNGDGEVTQEEREAMMQAVQERIQSIANNLMGGGDGGSDDSGNKDPFNMLLQALAGDQDDNSDVKEELNELMEKLQEEGRTKENMMSAAQHIQTLIPSISLTV